jgi:hypothetical protein
MHFSGRRAAARLQMFSSGRRAAAKALMGLAHDHPLDDRVKKEILTILA